MLLLFVLWFSVGCGQPVGGLVCFTLCCFWIWVRLFVCDLELVGSGFVCVRYLSLLFGEFVGCFRLFVSMVLGAIWCYVDLVVSWFAAVCDWFAIVYA